MTLPTKYLTIGYFHCYCLYIISILTGAAFVEEHDQLYEQYFDITFVYESTLNGVLYIYKGLEPFSASSAPSTLLKSLNYLHIDWLSGAEPSAATLRLIYLCLFWSWKRITTQSRRVRTWEIDGKENSRLSFIAKIKWRATLIVS